MVGPRSAPPRSGNLRGRVIAPAVLGLAVALSGCSSATGGPGGGTTTGRPATASPAPGSTGPVGQASPPFEVAQASIEVSGSAATIRFAGRIVTGPLHVADAAFVLGGRRLTFSVTGLTYSAATVSASGPRGGRIAEVTVSGSGLGVAVHVDLRRAGSGRRFTVSGHQVGVEVR
jgi:hypothetical protein